MCLKKIISFIVLFTFIISSFGQGYLLGMDKPVKSQHLRVPSGMGTLSIGGRKVKFIPCLQIEKIINSETVQKLYGRKHPYLY